MKESNQVKKSKRGVRYETNPFISNAVTEAKTGVRRITNKTGDQQMIVSQTTGEIIAPAGFHKIEEVDQTQFVKLFVNGVKALKELTGAGTKVFEVLYREVMKTPGADVIWLDFHSIDQNVTPMGEATFYRGMKELLEKGFIAETLSTGKYFLNLSFMWNGDRLAFIKEYRLKGTKSADVAKREQLEGAGQQRLIE